MARLKTRFYEKEILEILQKKGGCMWGFNRLQKEGKFHRTQFSRYLQRMSQSGLITIVGENRKKYCIANLDLEKKFKKIYVDIIEIENELTNSNLKNKQKISLMIDLIKLILYERDKLDLLLLNPDNGQVSWNKRNFIENITNWLTNKLRNNINNLSPKERIKVFRSFNLENLLNSL